MGKVGKLFGAGKPPSQPKTPAMPKPEQLDQAGDSVAIEQRKKKGLENAFGSVGNTGLKTTLG
jgi:hypothetical protein